MPSTQAYDISHLQLIPDGFSGWPGWGGTKTISCSGFSCGPRMSCLPSHPVLILSSSPLAGMQAEILIGMALWTWANKHSNKCVSKMQIDKRGGAVKTMCNTPAPFSKATYPLLIVCLYLSYSKLLKLTAASNAGVHEKLAILDKYLVDNCGMVTRDHHLDDSLSLLHASQRRRWRQPRVGAINNIHGWIAQPHEWTLFMMQVTDATLKTNSKKNSFAPPPIWRP